MSGGNQQDIRSLAILILIGLLAAGLVTVFAVYLGYLRHRKPLLEVDATIDYSFSHYLHLVVFPRLAYRIHAAFSRKK